MYWRADPAGSTGSATALNDEMLGGHGSDVLRGGDGDDVLWGDEHPTANNAWQRDALLGGAGGDWLYPSHGTNRLSAGPGDDRVIAYYGHGTIDCGAGRDTARVRLNGAYRLRGCEVIQRFCAFGSDSHGGSRKPGARHRALLSARR